jgi:sRNA-binding regulator protein Hfq
VDDDNDDKEEDDDEDDGVGGNESGGTSSDKTSNSETRRALFVSPSVPNTKAAARGPGAGGKKTWASVAEDEYRKKKTKIQEGILEVARKRQEDFQMYVVNMSRAQAFKMAVSEYEMYKDDYPAQAMYYKNAMTSILRSETAADQQAEMPMLFDNAGTGV